MLNPWRLIPDGWAVVFEPLPGGLWGTTDQLHRVITIDCRLTQTQRRCTLAHELVHVKHGHDGRQPKAVELQVNREAARALLPLDDLADAMRWSRNQSELAECLWVTPRVLRFRLDSLTEEERAELHRFLS